MDWHGFLETAFLVTFWVGLVVTLVMAVLSGAFHTEFGSGSALEGGHATELGGTDIETGHFGSGEPHVGWVDSQFPGASPLSPTVIFSALTAFGGIGYLCLHQGGMGPGWSLLIGFGASVLIGGLSFFILDLMLRKLQATSHVSEQALVGTKASVQAPIESQQSGSIVLVAKGQRMTFPARAVDASAIPVGAEVEIRRVDGNSYIVEETRESWLLRSKSKPDGEPWNQGGRS